MSTSVQATKIQSCVQVSQNVSKDFVQVQLLQGSREFQTKTEELMAEQEHHFEKGDLDTFESKLKVAEKIDVENLPKDGIAQKIKLLVRETSEDTKESIQKKDFSFTHFKAEKAAPVFGPQKDAEQNEFFNLPESSSIYTDDLPDLEDVESTTASSHRIMSPKVEETE